MYIYTAGMETFQCIAKSKACDLTADCDGGKDEEVAWCEEEGITLSCAEGQIMCPDKSNFLSTLFSIKYVNWVLERDLRFVVQTCEKGILV